MTGQSPSPDVGNSGYLEIEAPALRPAPQTPRRKRSVGRRCSRADKWRIVEESYQPSTSVSLVARRYDVNANQVFNWRREARDGRLGRPPSGIAAARDEMAFLSLGVVGSSEDGVGSPTVGPPAPPIPVDLPSPVHLGVPGGVIEIELPDGIRLRVGSAVDIETLHRVLAVVKRT